MEGAVFFLLVLTVKALVVPLDAVVLLLLAHFLEPALLLRLVLAVRLVDVLALLDVVAGLLVALSVDGLLVGAALLVGEVALGLVTRELALRRAEGGACGKSDESEEEGELEHVEDDVGGVVGGVVDSIVGVCAVVWLMLRNENMKCSGAEER